MSDCVVCTQPSQDAFLCYRCGEDLARDLLDVPELVDELDTTRSRQDRIGGDNAGRRSAERALPWKEPASDAAWVLGNTLTTWARDLAETRHVDLDATTLADTALWLHNRLDWLRAHPAVEEAFGEIVAAVRNARRAVDRPAVLPYAGRCHECEEHMYARMDRPVVTCRACGHEHNTDRLRESLHRAVWHELRTAAEIAASLSTYLTDPLPVSTIKTWIERKQLVPKGRDAQRRPLYQVGDVITLAVSRPTRRGNGHAA